MAVDATDVFRGVKAGQVAGRRGCLTLEVCALRFGVARGAEGIVVFELHGARTDHAGYDEGRDQNQSDWDSQEPFITPRFRSFDARWWLGFLPMSGHFRFLFTTS